MDNNSYSQYGQDNPQLSQQNDFATEQQNYRQQNPTMPPVKPNNNLIMAIFTTICCCLPFGIVGIIKATKVDSYYNAGQYQAAQAAANDAKKWSLIGIVVGLVVQIIYLAFYGFAILGNLTESM